MPGAITNLKNGDGKMKIEIRDEEHTDILAQIAGSALELLKEENGYQYLVVHGDDGTCIKTGTHEDGQVWIVKYTEDDPEVQ